MGFRKGQPQPWRQKKTPIADRFWAKVDKRGPDECWLWTASGVPKGYGTLGVGRREEGKVYAHRLSVQLAGIEIPDGAVVDHLCSTPRCVNPAHLEVVTQKENLRRADGGPGRNARKTHCTRGHEFTPENTYLYRGKRGCRTCIALRDASRSRVAEEITVK